MNFDLSIATEEDIKKELNRGYFKQIVLGAVPDMPKEAKKIFLFTASKIKQSKFYKDSYSVAYFEEYIPMTGKMWRMFVYKKDKALENLKEEKNLSLKYLIGSNQVVSIYYDNNSVLSVIDKPYFEIYDGNDIGRFYPEEYRDLTNAALEILERKY